MGIKFISFPTYLCMYIEISDFSDDVTILFLFIVEEHLHYASFINLQVFILLGHIISQSRKIKETLCLPYL